MVENLEEIQQNRWEKPLNVRSQQQRSNPRSLYICKISIANEEHH